jgi:DNA-binding Lrp family transcriptional regulator
MSLDRTDFGLLQALQQDARMTNKELAASVGVSASTCLERVRRLRQSGVLRGYYADVDPAAVGIQVQAMVSVQLAKHALVSFDSLRDHLLSIPEVVSVYLLAGAQDFLVHVVANSVNHLRDVVSENFAARDDVAHIETSLIFDHARSHELPNFVAE